MRARLGFTVALATTIAAGFIGPIDVAQAATIAVTSTGDDNPTGPDDGDCTLREAIDAANSNAAEDACPAGQATSSDLIVLPPGTYSLSVSGTGEDDGNTGDFDIRSGLTIQGAGPATTTIDAGEIDRAFHIPSMGPVPEVEISGVSIRDGLAIGDGGGAVFNQGADLRLVRVSLTDNRAHWGGGTATEPPASLTVIDSLIEGNTANSNDLGGGIFLVGVEANLTNVSVSGNTAGDAGGIWGSGGGVTLNNVTVTSNTATPGNGGGVGGSASVILRNTVVAGNSDTTDENYPDCTGSITSQGHSIIGNNTGCSFTPTTGDKVGTAAAPIDANLGLLADNGGPTLTHALFPGSPAIDAGDPALPGSGGTACAATDQRGAPRNCDIGAYELVECLGTTVNRVGTSGHDTLVGTPGNDGFLGLEGNDTMSGLGGADRICSGPGKDVAKGGAGNDKLLGEGGRDALRGGGGRDRLVGGPGRDSCVGGGGKDKGVSCKSERGIP